MSNKYLTKVALEHETPKDPSYARAIGRGVLQTIGTGMVSPLASIPAGMATHVATRGLIGGKASTIAAGVVGGAIANGLPIYAGYHGYKASMKNQAHEEAMKKMASLVKEAETNWERSTVSRPELFQKVGPDNPLKMSGTKAWTKGMPASPKSLSMTHKPTIGLKGKLGLGALALGGVALAANKLRSSGDSEYQ
jgi:hypothetical protein